MKTDRCRLCVRTLLGYDSTSGNSEVRKNSLECRSLDTNLRRLFNQDSLEEIVGQFRLGKLAK